MFLILIIILIILLLFLNCNVEKFTSGGTNIDLNSNDASLTETTLSQYRPYRLSTFYERYPVRHYKEDSIIYPSSYGDYPIKELEHENIVIDGFDNTKKKIHEEFVCCNKKNNRKFFPINNQIVSNDYVQAEI